MLKGLSSLRTIAELLGGSVPVDSTVTSVSIDTRTLAPGALFFALRGERTDGHNFVKHAFAAGAAGVIVERSSGISGPRTIAVDDPAAALARLGAEARLRWAESATSLGHPRRVTGVTGSAGKTTTKDMIAAVLAAAGIRARRTEGNLNNHLGVPLSLLRLEDSDDAAVFELAMSAAGEIAQLANWTKPHIGVVTCVAPVHLMNFGSVDEIAAAKYELIASLDPVHGAAVLNADDSRVSRFVFPGRRVTFGLSEAAGIRATNVKFAAATTFQALDTRFELHLPGAHQVHNALAALAVATLFEIPAAAVAAALHEFQPSRLRGETFEFDGATLVADCYNSNPLAVQGMLDWLRRVPARGRRIAVLGEMLELGPAAADLHRQAGAQAAASVSLLIGVRGMAEEVVAGARAAGMPAGQSFFAATPEEAAAILRDHLSPGDLVLLKASRGVQLERTLAALGALREEAVP